jgi:hypothetical protein
MTTPQVVAEAASRELEAKGAYVGRPSYMSALGMFILSSQVLGALPSSTIQPTASLVQIQTQSSTFSSIVISKAPSSLDLFRAIDKIYDELLNNTVELDADSHRVLYEDRWSLYE